MNTCVFSSVVAKIDFLVWVGSLTQLSCLDYKTVGVPPGTDPVDLSKSECGIPQPIKAPFHFSANHDSANPVSVNHGSINELVLRCEKRVGHPELNSNQVGSFLRFFLVPFFSERMR